MSKHSIMKELDSELSVLTDDSFQETFYYKKSKWSVKKLCAIFLGIFLVATSGLVLNNLKVANMEAGETISPGIVPVASTAGKKDIITIPTGVVKANPFVPYRTLGNEIKVSNELINDVPKYDLISPPETLVNPSDAAKIMTTTVSGILYDKYSPSAILNIDGNDYLVKKGDTVHKYTVTSIAKDSVTVRVGKNTYTAGIGELLTDGSVNYNDVSNLSKKFGGERR